MAVVSERVRVMKQNFMALHLKGYSIPEIARKYDLCKVTVYRHLQEIADENGVTRNELLQIVRSSNESVWKSEERRVRLDIEALQQQFSKAEKAIASLNENIDKILEEINNEYDT